MSTLESDARRAVASGLTSPHEIARLVHAAEGSSVPCRQCGAGVPIGAQACPACGHPRVRRCSCGEVLERGWRYCPWCIRPARG